MKTLPDAPHPVKTLCNVDGCDRPVKARGLCNTHYMRRLRHGDPTVTLPAGRPPMNDETRRKLWDAEADEIGLWYASDAWDADAGARQSKNLGLKATRLGRDCRILHARSTIGVEGSQWFTDYAQSLAALLNDWAGADVWEAAPTGTGVDPFCRCGSCQRGTVGTTCPTYQNSQNAAGRPELAPGPYWRERNARYHDQYGGLPTSEELAVLEAGEQ